MVEAADDLIDNFGIAVDINQGNQEDKMTQQDFTREEHDSRNRADAQNGHADDEKFERRRKSPWERMMDVFYGIAYPTGRTSAHAEGHKGQRDKKKAKRRARNKMVRKSRKHARPKYTRRGK